MTVMDPNEIYKEVKDRYGSAAADSVTGDHQRKVAKAFGYTEEELANTPGDANLGLSCGNPLALAKLSEGETVIDLGSGAGFDVFLAAKRVGSSGKAIGVDMTKEMLDRANRNKEKTKADNVEFVDSAITKIALPDGIADCIISNCVVNLVPEQEKQLAFNEMFRLLKPGGRVAISDILLKTTLSEEIRTNMALYVGCIAGASQVNAYESYLRDAGFNDILIVDNHHDLNVYTATEGEETKQVCCATAPSKGSSCGGGSKSATANGSNGTKNSMSDFKDIDFNKWAGSFQIYALKP